MDSLDEVAILLAVGLPFALIGIANLLLALSGERGTLLLPSREPLATPAEAAEEAPGALATGPISPPRSPISAVRRLPVEEREPAA